MAYEEWQCPNGCFRVKVGDSIAPDQIGDIIDEVGVEPSKCFRCGEQMKQVGYVEKTEDAWTTARIK